MQKIQLSIALVAVLVLGPVVSGLVLPQEVTASGTGTCQDIMVPAYFYPSQPTSAWDTMATSHSDNQFSIMNPASGPGTASNSDYVTEMAQAQSAGELVMGYIATGYGVTATSSVFDQVDKYHDWYEVDGIFLDEVASGVNMVDYYQAVVDYVVEEMPGTDIILNHGVYPVEDYMDLDSPTNTQLTHVVFEGQYSTYTQATVPTWADDYDGERFAHLVYNATTTAQMEDAVELSDERNAGYIYVTHDLYSNYGSGDVLNPWDELPTYYSNLLTETACD